MSDEKVLFQKEDHVAVIKFNRPEALNALNLQMRERMDEIIAEVAHNQEIRVLVILGEGKAFCSGQDLKEGSPKRNPAEHLNKKWEDDFQMRLEKLPIPIIVGMQGYAFGRGLEVALTCDIRVAAEDAVFSLPEVKLGMLPGSGGTQRLSRVIGVARALQMILTAERINAVTALQWGLVTRIVKRDELESVVMETALQMAASAPLAMRYAKAAIRQSTDLPLAEGLRNEAVLSAVLMGTEDRAEGILAFREKRKPQFLGK